MKGKKYSTNPNRKMRRKKVKAVQLIYSWRKALSDPSAKLPNVPGRGAKHFGTNSLPPKATASSCVCELKVMQIGPNLAREFNTEHKKAVSVFDH